MKYQHTPKFQFLMQKALRKIYRSEHLTDERIINLADLSCSKSTLYRFRSSPIYSGDSNRIEESSFDGFRKMEYLDYFNAEKLWDYLSYKDAIEAALFSSEAEISKCDLFDSRQLANTLMCWCACHESQISDMAKNELDGEYLCYKLSLRKEDYIVKSLVNIKIFQEEYIEISEYQRSSGYAEADGSIFDEKSHGVGFSKSNKLWFFMIEEDMEQPRIACFDRIKAPRSVDDPSRSRITILHGKLLESSTRFLDGLFSFNILLVKKDVDQRMYAEVYENYEYDIEDQIDLYKIGGEGKKVNGSYYNFACHEYVVGYLKEGKYDL